MTIRVICSLSLKKAIISTRLEKGTSWSGPLLWSWCSLVSGYCYTKSGSKGPILCPRKDNENPTTTDETFNAFFLLPPFLTFIYFKDRDATSYKLSTLSPFFGSLIYHDTRKEGNWQETRQAAAAAQWKLHTLLLYSPLQVQHNFSN